MIQKSSWVRLDKKTLKEWSPVADCISMNTIAEQIVSVSRDRRLSDEVLLDSL